MVLLDLFLTLLTSTAFAVGFSSGNNFSAVGLSGTVNVQCPHDASGNAVTAVFTCRQSLLEPAMYDYFLGPQGVDADSIELVVTRADRSVRVKTEKYDSRKSVSREKFNLWDSGLFQKSLLADGNNRVEYRLYRAGQLQTSGEVTVMVSRVQNRQCQSGNYVSTTPSDCQNQLTMCGSYFETNNFCR